jgi:hypothetical protein
VEYRGGKCGDELSSVMSCGVKKRDLSITAALPGLNAPLPRLPPDWPNQEIHAASLLHILALCLCIDPFTNVSFLVKPFRPCHSFIFQLMFQVKGLWQKAGGARSVSACSLLTLCPLCCGP